MKSIKTKPRTKADKNDQLRNSGEMPAVFYGRDTESQSIAVDQIAFEKLWYQVGAATIFEIEDADGNTNPALIQDVDIHPVTDRPIHADFYLIEEGQTVTVDVPVVAENDAPAVKNIGGLLVQVARSLEIEAQPDDLPEELAVDVSGLEEFGHQATIEDIDVPEGVTINAEDNEVLFLIEEPEELEELEPDMEDEGPDFDDIEVEGEADEEPEEGEEAEGETDVADAEEQA